MDKIIRKRRGGPRTFDRTEAIDTAMRLFWRHGYEGVSLNDLTAAIGVAPPSLYAAFGSKAGLYREALDHYSGLPGGLSNLPKTETLTEAVGSLLRKAIDAVLDPGGEKGCMVSSGMVQSASAHEELALELAKRRSEMHDTIAETLTRWLDPDPARSLARYLLAILQGLSVQARDGATREELEQVMSHALASLSRDETALIMVE